MSSFELIGLHGHSHKSTNDACILCVEHIVLKLNSDSNNTFKTINDGPHMFVCLFWKILFSS